MTPCKVCGNCPSASFLFLFVCVQGTDGSTLRSLSVNSLPDNIGKQTVAEATPKVSLDLDERDRGDIAAGGPMVSPGSEDKMSDSPERESSEAIDIDARSSGM